MTTTDAVKEALSMDWYAAHEVRDYVKRVTGKYRSESGISARIRDLRKPEYGGFQVERRPASNGGDHFEYRLMVQSQDRRGSTPPLTGNLEGSSL